MAHTFPLRGILSWQRDHDSCPTTVSSLPPLAVPKIVLQPDGTFGLPLHSYEQWLWLEQSLIHATQVLMDAGVGFPDTVSWFPFPQEFGYQCAHKTYSRAYRCAMASRDAFRPLIGGLLLMFACRADPVAILERQSTLSSMQIADLCELLLFRITGTLPGVILPVFEYCQWHDKIWDMIKSHNKIPVWYAFGNETHKFLIHQSLRPLIRNCAPSDSEVHHLIAFEKARRESAALVSLLPTQTSLNNPEAVHPHAALMDDPQYQPPGAPASALTSEDFASARPWWKIFLEQKEHKISAAQQNASIAHCRGPSVFYWQKDGNRCVRHPIDRNLRVFDEVSNTWDVCTQFDPSEYEDGPGHADDEDSDEPRYRDNHSSPFTFAAPPTILMPLSTSISPAACSCTPHTSPARIFVSVG
ncbi:hypothetical protein BJ138DRAFT_1119777 [Hygrophoropsis aurantiaca]|uniref:Uncharacterized protein n=1 Tax=Hygrophoropsis aurantiaca TaxID=72124 RepID=A0ACB7ZTK1_9AGAM|nr:hypothetical protein BJ138DRAFT_1119777 [Hygrophoropsis aurantiaca]